MRDRRRGSRELPCIRYRILEGPWGWLAVAAGERGLCRLLLGDDPRALARELAEELAPAALVPDAGGLDASIRALWGGPRGAGDPEPLPLDERGTPFQRRVWAAIREIPFGTTRSYAELARAVGRPTAARAVARACGANPLPLVTPCHRVVASDGGPGGYRYGAARKRALLEAERRGPAAAWRSEPAISASR